MNDELENLIRGAIMGTDIQLPKCKYCNEDIIFLPINEKYEDTGKNKLVPFSLNLTKHRESCRAKSQPWDAKPQRTGKRNNRDSDQEDRW